MNHVDCCKLLAEANIDVIEQEDEVSSYDAQQVDTPPTIPELDFLKCQSHTT